MRRIVQALTFALALLATSSSSSAQPPATFGSVIEVELVELDLLVVDRDGRPILDLGPDEIHILEDGKAVELAFFEEPDSARAALGASTKSTTTEGTAGSVQSRSRDGRYVVIFVDNVNVGPESRRRALGATWLFLDEWLPRDDKIALATYETTGVSLRVPFTRNRKKILNGLRSVESITAERLAASLDEHHTLQLIQQLQKIQVESLYGDPCVNIGPVARTFADTQLKEIQATADALTAFVDSLAGLPGRKLLFHLSDGIPLVAGASVFEYAIELCDGSGLREGLPYAIDRSNSHFAGFDPRFARMEVGRFDTTTRFEKLAAHANAHQVTFFTLQASGTRRPTTSGADSAVRITTTNNENHRARNVQETLHLLADETGGRAILDQNDLDAGLSRIAEDLASGYRLAYRTPNPGDGEVHRIKVEVDRPGAKVRHRRRYRSKSIHHKIADQVSSLLLHDTGENSLGLRVAITGQEPAEDELVKANFRIQVPLDGLTLLPQGPVHHGLLTLFLAARDLEGRRTPIRQSTVPIFVPIKNLEETEGRYFTYNITMVMRPGNQDVGIALLDEIGRRTTFLKESFEVARP